MGSHTRFGLTLLLVAYGCQPNAPEPPTLAMTPEKAIINGRTERAIIRLRAYDVDGVPGAGVVTLTPSVGQFVEGNAVNLVDGRATVTFRCDPGETSACAGEVRLGATWNDVIRTVLVRVDDTAVREIRWRVLPTNTTSTLQDAAAAPDGTVWAVGERGCLVRLSEQRWHVLNSGTTRQLNAVSVTTSGDVLIAGEHTTLVRFLAGQALVSTFDDTDDFTGVWGRDASDVFLSTSSGRVVHFDGTNFTETRVSTTALRSLSGEGASAWAVSDTQLYALEAGAWVTKPNPATATWERLRALNGGLWLVGNRLSNTMTQGLLVAGPLPHWRTAMSGPRFIDVAAAPNGEERMAVTSDEVYLQRGDGPWLSLEAPSGGAVIVMRRDGDAVVVGPSGVSLLRIQ